MHPAGIGNEGARTIAPGVPLWYNGSMKTETKVCTGCGDEKALTEFHKRCDSKDGHCCPCKKCVSKEKRQHYHQNKERIKEEHKQYRRRVKLAAFDAYGGCICAHPGCGVTNPDLLTIDHIDGDGARHRREIGIGTGTAFYRWLRGQGYPSGYQVLCRNHNSSKGVAGEGLVSGEGEYYWGLKLAALEAYGGPVCIWPGCDTTDLDLLTLDHIDGGGNEHRREIGGSGACTYRWLRDNNYPPGWQVLCWNHNWLKYVRTGR